MRGIAEKECGSRSRVSGRVWRWRGGGDESFVEHEVFLGCLVDGMGSRPLLLFRPSCRPLAPIPRTPNRSLLGETPIDKDARLLVLLT
jgi:hypothetical protein